MAFFDELKDKYKNVFGGGAKQVLSNVAREVAEIPTSFVRSFPESSGARPLGTSIGVGFRNWLDSGNMQENSRRLQEQNQLNLERIKKLRESGNVSSARDLARKNLTTTTQQANVIRGQQGNIQDLTEQYKKQILPSAARVGLTVLGSGNLGGASGYAGLGLRTVAPNLAIGGGFGAGMAALFGQDITQSAGQGMADSFKYRGLNKLTAPFIDPVVEASGNLAKLSPQILGQTLPIGKILARAITSGGANVLEDIGYNKLAEGRGTGAGEMVTSFILGAALSPTVKYDPDSSFIKITDDNKLSLDNENIERVVSKIATWDPNVKRWRMNGTFVKEMEDKIKELNKQEPIKIFKNGEYVTELVPKWRKKIMEQPAGMSMRDINLDDSQSTLGDISDDVLEEARLYDKADDFLEDYGLFRNVKEGDTGRIDIEKLTLTKDEIESAKSNIDRGLYAQTKGPVEVYYSPKTGRMEVANGYHRIVEALENGQRQIDYKVKEVYDLKTSPDKISDITRNAQYGIKEAEEIFNRAKNVAQAPRSDISLPNQESRASAITSNLVGEQNPILKRIQNLGQGSQTVEPQKQSIKVKSPSKDIVSEGLDLVRQAIYAGDEDAARAIYKTIDGKKPNFKSLVNEVTGVQDAEIKSVKKVTGNKYGEYEDVVKKFKTFLKRSGEKPGKTGMLNREHISVEKYGISSDEVADALGMSEKEFMAEITKDLEMAGSGRATPQQVARLDQNMKKIKNLVTQLGLDKEFYKINTDQLGRRLGVSAAPGGEMSPKTIRKVKTRAASAAKKDFEQWQREVVQQAGGNRTTRQAVDVIARSMAQNTRGAGDISNTKDISNLSKGFNTVYRNFQRVFGDRFPQVKKQVLDPFDASKGRHIDELNARADALESNITKGLGIDKGSKESAAVQLYGEGKKNYDDLVKEFGKNKADKIVQADKWFRQQYDQLLDEVNAVRKQIYPNNPDKIIPKRKNYYRHFREMREGFGALVNIFDQPGNIAPGLESISETTKPKAKWLSFAQKRIGDKSDIDAVGGFLDYIRASSYAKHIDPHIQVFRNLREDLVKATENVDDPNYGRVNNFINFLDKYANDLSGKTNQADRVFQEIVPGGRRAFAALNWLNNRVKANVILGNVSSSLAQVLNLPQGVASAGRYNVPGLGRTMTEMFTDSKAIQKSDFIKERYSGDVFSRFDKGMVNNTKKFAVWMTQALDEVSTKYMWNSHYEKAIREGLGDPVKYADDITRSLVGGRGIGEVPLMQKAKTFQLIAPFQLEVGNFWYVMKDMVDEKQFGKLATLFVTSHILNKGLEAVRGSGGSFDPIQAMIDMYDISQDGEEDKALRMVGRGAGEILSNVPLGQSVAGAYPEYGFKVGEKQYPTREDLFGDADPTRFGSGLLAMKGLQDPLYKVLPPFGGNQIKKTVTGLQAYDRGYSESKTGRVRFPIDKNPVNAIKSAAFGEYSTKDARDYFDKDTTPLGDNQSQTFKKLLLTTPDKALDYYNSIMSGRGGEVKTVADATMQVYADGGNPLPKEKEMLGVLYKKGKGVVDGYEEDKLLIEQDPTLAYDEKVDRLNELDTKISGWQQVVGRIEKERPEQVLSLEVETHVSGGGKTTEERAKWAYNKIYEIPKEKRADFVKRLLDEKVLTKSVVEAIKDEYGLLIPLYNEGGKIKKYSTGGSRKVKKLPKDLFKPVKVSIPKSRRRVSTRRRLRRIEPINTRITPRQVVKI